MARSVLVTGSSTGIGEATALRLAEAGWQVFAGVRKEADGERLAAGARGRLMPLTLDVTDEAHIEAAAKTIGEETNGAGLSALVNNAGIGRGGAIELLGNDDWREQFEVNVIGQVAVTRHALPLVRKAGGRIVFIGSVAGRIAGPFFGPYAASKHALEAVAESLREELRPWRLPVVMIEPGAIKTPIWDKARALGDELEQRFPEEAQAMYADRIEAVKRSIDTSDRMGIPAEEVAKVVDRALTVPRPRARYTVGKDATAGAIMSRLLPDRAKAAVLRRFGPS